jgi:hypothetical protein
MKHSMPYETWPVIEEATTDGWRFGTAMSFVGKQWGDAFVEAPDGSRAGLVWVVGESPLATLLPAEPDRWGVYRVSFPRAMASVQDLVANFASVLPQLKSAYEAVRRGG